MLHTGSLHTGRALVAAADTAVVARSLMYSSVRQATSDLTSAVLGADAGSVVAEGLDTIVAAQARRSRLEPNMDPALHASAHHGAISPRT